MSKHTPGPWHIQQGDSGETFIKPIPGQVVAVIEPQANSETEKDNARIIAAAPEMLVALEKIISSWERERLHSNQGNNHAQDEAELEKNYQIALAKLMICEKIKAAK